MRTIFASTLYTHAFETAREPTAGAPADLAGAAQCAASPRSAPAPDQKLLLPVSREYVNDERMVVRYVRVNAPANSPWPALPLRLSPATPAASSPWCAPWAMPIAACTEADRTRRVVPSSASA